MDKVSLPFDRPHAQHITHARTAGLSQILTACRPFFPITTALDAGTGVGYIASYLSHQHHLQVTAFDVRRSNVEEAQRRYSEIRFVVRDAEDPGVLELGQFDLVTAFGLLYHLENPLCAVRNLAQLTRRLLIVESMIAPGRMPEASLLDEYPGDDQAIRYIAFHLTEPGLIKLLYRAEMSYVYLPRVKVDHAHFRGGLFRRRMRTVLVASREPLNGAFFKLMQEPQNKLDRSYYYRLLPQWVLRSLFHFARSVLRAP